MSEIVCPVHELVGVRHAAGTASIPPDALKQLALGGVIQGWRAAGKLFVDQGDVAVLASAPLQRVTTPAVVVRVAPAVVMQDDPTRAWAGYAHCAGPAERRAGVDRWWRFARPIPEMAYFLVTLGGFLVDAGRLHGLVPLPGGGRLSRVLVDWDDQGDFQVGSWLRTGPGGPIAYLDGAGPKGAQS